MRLADPSPVEQLNSYWNARGTPGPAAAHPLLDRSLRETLEELYARDDARVPDARTLERVEQVLRDEIARNAPAPAIPFVTIQPDDVHRAGPRAAPGTGLPPAPRGYHPWQPRHLATVALVLLTLLGSLAVAHGVIRPARPDDPLMTITAIDETPGVVALPRVLQESVLMQGTFETFAPSSYWTGIARATLAPGAAFDLGKADNDGAGPLLYRVQFGELTVTADGPIRVTRAGSDVVETTPAGTEVILREGDQGFTPAGVASRWRNDREVPAVVLDVGITTYGNGALPAGVTHDALVATYGPAPQTPVDIAVREVTLSPSAVLALDEVPGLQLLYLESGQIQVYTSENVAVAANPLQPSGTVKGLRTLNAFGPVFQGEIPRRHAVRVAETGPATLLMLTMVEHRGSGPAPMN